MAKRIHTLNGSVEIDSLGLILPHEHLFTDRDFVPELLRRGITQEQVRLITVHNPARAFAF